MAKLVIHSKHLTLARAWEFFKAIMALRPEAVVSFAPNSWEDKKQRLISGDDKMQYRFRTNRRIFVRTAMTIHAFYRVNEDAVVFVELHTTDPTLFAGDIDATALARRIAVNVVALSGNVTGQTQLKLRHKVRQYSFATYAKSFAEFNLLQVPDTIILLAPGGVGALYRIHLAALEWQNHKIRKPLKFDNQKRK